MKIDLSGKIEHSGRGHKSQKSNIQQIETQQLHISLSLLWDLISIGVRYQT
jgi:hypothetical protein